MISVDQVLPDEVSKKMIAVYRKIQISGASYEPEHPPTPQMGGFQPSRLEEEYRTRITFGELASSVNDF
jgi:hypothetical protein